jgi:hypothetical protein
MDLKRTGYPAISPMARASRAGVAQRQQVVGAWH